MLHSVPLLATLLFPALPALPAQDAAPVPPRLVVLVCVDQLLPEQLDRLAPELDGGLGRFLREGTVFHGATLDYAATETGPGHATFGTGCLPAKHGIVGNAYHDREGGGTRYCVADEGARAVTSAGAAEGGNNVGPANLLVPTLGDRVVAVHPDAKVVAVSCKDRSAVGMGGRSARPALWWGRRGEGFVSSTSYGEALPDFVIEWNDGWVDAAAGWEWTPVFEGDPARWGTEADDRPGERPFGPQGTTFPYVLPDAEGREPAALAAELASAVYGCPLGDRFVAELARGAVDHLGLGADAVPDVLALGFSVCDSVGHSSGPYSWEVTDVVLRLDDVLGELFAHLDAAVGAGRWVAALSADHGVLELPESLVARGVGARRVSREEVGEMRARVRAALAEAYPEVEEIRPGFAGDFTLDEHELLDRGLDPAAVRATIARAAEEAPWVAAAYTLEDLEGAGSDGGRDDGWIALYRASFVRERSADVVLRLQPWHLTDFLLGTSHGSPYPYDRRVPLAFLGAPFAALHRYERASSVDAVPTVLAILGIEAEGLDGRALR